ncbi:hypothetical protein [Paenibacillus sp. FSL L8-0494]|uniref:hypothetical protein n=1 Tax=Paenibacillus sp. FSL L8-0494 TaxID=2975352 RepID=UPI0030F8BAE7
MTPERIEEVRRILSGMNQKSQLFPITVGDLNSLLADLEESQQEAERHRKVAEAKILFVSQGNEDYVYGLQEDLIEAQQTIARQQKVIDWYESGGSMGELVEEGSDKS